MTIFSSFSANFPPHYHTILAVNCVHASNWFTHLQPTQQIDGQNDNSVLTVSLTTTIVRQPLFFLAWRTLKH